jgi:hypothetical protein
LRLKHEMQCLEHWARHIPVVLVGLEVQGVRVGQEP